MKRRAIPREIVQSVLENPQQVVPERGEKKAYQSRLDFGGGKVLSENTFNEFSKMQIDLITVERQALSHMHRDGKASEEVIRKIERELDLEEVRLQMEMTN